MSESAPEHAGGTKKIFGLNRNVVIALGVAFGGTILYLWWKNRNSATTAAGTATGQGQQAFTTQGIDYSGQLSTIQSEIESLLAQQGAGSTPGSSGSSGGGSWGGWGSGSGSSYGSWDSGTGQGSSPGDGGTSSGTSGSGGGTSGAGSSSGGTSGGGGPPPAPSGGRATSVSNNRATIAWNGNGASYWKLVITGPGPINGHTATVYTPQGVYGGLQAGHNYEVTITPYNSSGQAGPPGRIDFKTTR